MKSLKKYSLTIAIIMLLSACANQATFEWIKINPDKIKEANSRVAYRNGIRNIDLTLDLKEKNIPIYYESPEAFEAGNSSPLVITKPEVVIKNSKNTKRVTKPIVVNKKVPNNPAIIKSVAISKPVTAKIVAFKPSKPIIKKPVSTTPKTSDSLIPDEERKALNQLNGALKIPKKPVKLNSTTNKDVKNTAEKISTVSQKTIIKKLKEKTKPIIVQKAVKKELNIVQEKKDNSKLYFNARRGNNFIFAGAALTLMGVVLGLIFGKSAYLVSGAGLIFAAIGFILKA